MSGGPSSIHKSTLDRQLADMEQRLRALERSATTLSRSALPHPDDADKVTVEMGELTTQSDTSNADSLDVDGSHGLAVYRWDGTERVTGMRVSDDRGLEAPLSYATWVTGTIPSVSLATGTWTTVWTLYLQNLDSDCFSTEWFMDTPVGTTVEVLFDMPGTGGQSDTFTTVGAGQEIRKLRWLHEQPLDAWPTSTYQVRMRARRTAGAGTTVVYQPIDMAQGDLPGATTGGVYL